MPEIELLGQPHCELCHAGAFFIQTIAVIRDILIIFLVAVALLAILRTGSLVAIP